MVSRHILWLQSRVWRPALVGSAATTRASISCKGEGILVKWTEKSISKHLLPDKKSGRGKAENSCLTSPLQISHILTHTEKVAWREWGKCSCHISSQEKGTEMKNTSLHYLPHRDAVKWPSEGGLWDHTLILHPPQGYSDAWAEVTLQLVYFISFLEIKKA